MPSNLARALGVLGVRTADKDGKSFSHGVVAACRNLAAAHFSEVRGLPVVMEYRPCVPGLVESDFRKETQGHGRCDLVHCIAFTRSSTSRSIRLHGMTWTMLLFAVA